MRKLVISAVLVVGGLGILGCQQDAHDLYVEREWRQSLQVDGACIVDDVHDAILMDQRPTHLSFFIQE